MLKWSDESEQTVTSCHVSSWCQLSTWKHTHRDVEMQVWGCLIDPLEDCKAQPSLGDRVNHLSKEEPWPQRCRMSQTLCQGLGNQSGRQGFPGLRLIAGRGCSWKKERSVTLDNALDSTFLGSCSPEDVFSLPNKGQYNDTLPPGLHPL